MPKKLTVEQFIERSIAVHGEKYDYSKVIYKGNANNVIIICPEHGEFEQRPIHHLNGSGCSSCTSVKKLTTKEFIKRSSIIHNNKYNYTNSIYVNSSTKIKIICPEHGQFEQWPRDHYSGTGCPKCSSAEMASKKVLTESDVIKGFRYTHGDRYDYSKMVYTGSKNPIIITCSIHGDFYQLPNAHQSGHGCPKCGKEQSSQQLVLTQKEVLKRFAQVHRDRYDYSKFSYTGVNSKSVIICPKHGEFEQKVFYHLNGSGCPKCGKEKVKNSLYSTQEEVLERFTKIHGDRYDYSKVNYIGNREPVTITCSIHGDFDQVPMYHLKGCNCPKCANSGVSKYETEIIDIIKTFYDGEIIQSYRPDFLNRKEIDIFIPEFNFGIEFNGAYWHSDKFKDQWYHFDKWKLCRDNGVKLLNIWDFYWSDSIKKSIYISKIKHHMLFDTRIFARKCSIVNIPITEAISFHRGNHIEGFNIPYGGLQSFGLVDPLGGTVMVISVGRFFHQSKKCFVNKIQRVSTLLGNTVVGGISKLLKHIRINGFENTIFQATLDTGGTLLTEDISRRNVSLRYWWVNLFTGDFLTRNSTQVSILKRNPDWENIDTETSYMERNGYIKVFDTGIVNISK